MSALPPKADMLSVEINVCFVPEADLRAMSQYSVECERTRSETRSVALQKSLYFCEAL